MEHENNIQATTEQETLINKSKLSLYLFAVITLFLVELFLGGGGRIFIVFGVPLRMILFMLLIIGYVGSIVLNREKIVIDLTAIIVVCLLFWFMVSFLIGIISDHDKIAIIEGIKPLSFFLIYFPLNHYILSKEYPLKRIIKMLEFSGIIISIVTLLILLNSQLLNFDAIYTAVNSSATEDSFEFVYRPNGGAFYKGHIYVMITFFLCLAELAVEKTRKFRNILIVSLCFLSIFLTGTRGLLIATVVGVCYLLSTYLRRFSFQRIVIILIVFLLGVGFINFFAEYSDLDRTTYNALSEDEGVQLRKEFSYEGIDIIISSPITFFIGSGLGTALTDRPIHREVSFLDIMLEQGLIGFLLWVCLLLRIAWVGISSLRYSPFNPVVHCMLAGLIGLTIFTNTNPVINNPIGIGFLMTAEIILKKVYFEVRSSKQWI